MIRIMGVGVGVGGGCIYSFDFLSFFTREATFITSCFAFMHTYPLLKINLLLRDRIYNPLPLSGTKANLTGMPL